MAGGGTRLALFLRRGAPVTFVAAAGGGAYWWTRSRNDEELGLLGASAAGRGSSGDILKVDVLVVGGGLSGLSAGYHLLKTPLKFLVTESDSRVGGVVSTKQDGDYLWDCGPNSFRPTPKIISLVSELGLGEQLRLGDPKAPRYVLWEGRLRQLPMSLYGAFFGDWLSVCGKLRFFGGLVGLKPRRPAEEESIETWATRNFGKEAFDRLVDPFVSGVYSGDPSRLSISATVLRKGADLEKEGGSVMGGMIAQWRAKRRLATAPVVKAEEIEANDPSRQASKPPKVKGHTVASFAGGLEVLTTKMEETLVNNLNLRWTLRSLQREGDGYRTEFHTPDGPRVVQAKTVVLAIPSYAAGEVLKGVAPKAAEALKSIEYNKLAEIWTVYPKTAVREPAAGINFCDGFGHLIPRSCGVRTLGTIYCNSMFPDRAPKDEVMLLSYIGGARDKELFGGLDELSAEDLVAQVHKDAMKTVLKPDAPEPKVLDMMVWEWAIPQPTLGHDKLLASTRRSLDEAGMTGVLLAGNYTSSVAFSGCIERGEEVVAEAQSLVTTAASSGKA